MKLSTAAFIVLTLLIIQRANALSMKDTEVAQNIPKCLEDEKNCRIGDDKMMSWRKLHTAAGCGYSSTKTPKIIVDDSYVAMCQAHQLTSAGTIDQFISALNDICSRGDLQKKTVLSKIKTLHFYSLPDKAHPASAFDSPDAKFELKSGELRVGYHWQNENTGQKLRDWLDKNL